MIQTQNNKLVLVTPPGAIIDNAALAAASIDTLGFDYCDIYVILGATDIAMTALKVQSSPDGNTKTDVAGANFATATGAHLPSATDDNTAHGVHVNLLGKDRYLHVAATGGDGTAGAYIMVIAILSRAKESPGSATKRGLKQELFV